MSRLKTDGIIASAARESYDLSNVLTTGNYKDAVALP